MIRQREFAFETGGGGEMRDLTQTIAGFVRESGIRSGLVHVFNIGSTGSIGTIEFEPGLRRDLPETLSKIIPPGRSYGHEQTWHDGNAHSHLHATILGPELTVPVKDGDLVLGTWQQIFHIDCDNKPHRRRVFATVMGE